MAGAEKEAEEGASSSVSAAVCLQLCLQLGLQLGLQFGPRNAPDVIGYVGVLCNGPSRMVRLRYGFCSRFYLRPYKPPLHCFCLPIP